MVTKKGVMLFLMVAIMLAVSSFSVNASHPQPQNATGGITISLPAASDTMNGNNTEWNGTIVNQSSGGVLNNVSGLSVNITFGGASGGNAPVACTNSSLTAGTSRWNCKVNLSGLNGYGQTSWDNTSAIFNVSVFNSSNAKLNSTTVTITIDNTPPRVDFKRQELQARTFGSLYADCSDTSDNIDGTPTFQINLVRPGGTNATTVITSSAGTFGGDDLSEAGIYTLSCTVQDNAANAISTLSRNSARQTISITVSGGGLSPGVVEQVINPPAPSKGLSSTMVLILVGVAIVVVFGRDLFGGKK